jgi:hypothetical protein
MPFNECIIENKYSPTVQPKYRYMKIETKLDFKSYVKLMYTLTYRREVIILFSILGLCFFLFLGLVILGSIKVSNVSLFPLFFLFVVLFGIPILVYYSAKKNFQTHARLQEKITYEITDDFIKITGESFKSHMTWNKTYKVLEIKDWFLFYENKLIANIIPKEFIGKQIPELRDIVKRQQVNSRLMEN